MPTKIENFINMGALVEDTSGGVLLKAVSAGRVRQVRLLLDSGVDIEREDDCGQTALIRAIFVERTRSREKIIRILLRHGARVSHADIVGRTAVSWACMYGRDREVTQLLQHADVDFDPNKPDSQGSTPLLYAVSSGSAGAVKTMVEVLRRYDLSVDVPNNSGITPLTLATQLGYDVCASILIQQGNATAGSVAPDRWAIKTRPGILQNSKSQFPPILEQAVAQKIKFRENRASQQRIYTPVESDEDSSYGSEVSYYSDQSFDHIHIGSPRGGAFSPLLTRRTPSLTSSTEGNISSSADEADLVSQPVTEIRRKKRAAFQPARDLYQIFRIIEQEMSPAYRQPAVTPSVPRSTTPLSESRGIVSSTPRKSKGKKTSDPRQVDLRRHLLSKSNKSNLVAQDCPVSSTYLPAVIDSLSSSSDESLCSYSAPRKQILPKISKTIPLIQNHRANATVPSPKNYSYN